MRRAEFIARQGRRPSGLLGACIGRIMAWETAAENEIGLQLLDLASGDQVLEVGFGHGRTLAKAATLVGDGFVTGIDYSRVMVRLAGHRNRAHLRHGRMALNLADSERIPYPAGRFNKALAVHTIYFWSAPQHHLAEIFRTMAKGGRFVLGYRPREDPGFAAAFPAAVYHIRSIGETEALVRQSGFRIVETAVRNVGSRDIAWTVAEKS